MLTLETAVSCWRYSRLLCYHLSGFVLYPPERCRVIVTVCYCGDSAEDAETIAVLDYFANLPPGKQPPNVTWNWRPYERRRLMRRAIARNEICRETAADFLLMGDADYFFHGHGAIDAAADAMAAACVDGPHIMHPATVMMSRRQSNGDAEINRVRINPPGVIDIRERLYRPVPLDRAIGGAQWVPGIVARSKGYIPQYRQYHRPSQEWRRTFCDSVYRRKLVRDGISQVALDAPGVYRIRHSVRGRTEVGCRL